MKTAAATDFGTGTGGKSIETDNIAEVLPSTVLGLRERLAAYRPTAPRPLHREKMGLYLHIPFCRRKCNYCDFCSFPQADGDTVQAYTDALCRELILYAQAAKGRVFDTVYFGGGTPTLLDPTQWEQILNTVTTHYSLSADTEISTECNPATVTRKSLSHLRCCGVNRLSIGLQSAQENELRALGRIHSFEDFCETYENARTAGFGNVSADLMFGIPEQTPASFADTLQKTVALKPEHLSAYGLKVEPETPFGRTGKRLRLPDDDTCADLYSSMVDTLKTAGYARYEISNFSRPGYECRHNLKYWREEEYLGVGLAAHSFFEGVRWGHNRDLSAYLRGENTFFEIETISPHEEREEAVMLGMRMSCGIRQDEYCARYGVDFDDLYGSRLRRYEPDFVRKEGNRVFFTTRGMEVSNAILSEILDLDEEREREEHDEETHR